MPWTCVDIHTSDSESPAPDEDPVIAQSSRREKVTKPLPVPEQNHGCNEMRQATGSFTPRMIPNDPAYFPHNEGQRKRCDLICDITSISYPHTRLWVQID